jgi:tetratricopeptide (TPR) repeat protein
MRLLPAYAGVLLSFAAGSMTAATRSGNPARFAELIRQGRAAFLAADPDRGEAAWREACPADASAADSVGEAVTCENLLASVEEARGNLARAEQRYVRAAARAEQAGTPYLPIYCARLVDLAEYYHRRGRLAEAEQMLLKAVDLARRLERVVPALLPQALIRLGSLYADSPKPERGRGPLAEALAMAAPPADTAFAHNALGKVELACGHPREAEPHLREAVSFAETTLGEDHPATAAYQANLALALIAQGRLGGARLLLRRAQFVLESRHRAPGVELAAVCAELASVAASQGKMAEAQDYAMRALSILNLQPEVHVKTVAAAKVTLGSVYLRLHDVRAAESILPAAVEMERQTAANPGTLAAAIQLLAELRVAQRDWSAAEGLYREAAAIHPSAPVLRGLAEVLKQSGGSKREIRQLKDRARELGPA